MQPTLPLPTLLCRKVFSVQIRDFVDLCITRLADLNRQERTRRCKEPDRGRDRTPGMGESINRDTGHLDGDCGDPTTREVKSKGAAFAACVSRSLDDIQKRAGVVVHSLHNQRVDQLSSDRTRLLEGQIYRDMSSSRGVFHSFAESVVARRQHFAGVRRRQSQPPSCTVFVFLQKIYMSSGLHGFSLVATASPSHFAGWLFLAAFQADGRSAAGVENRYSLAPYVLGELPQDFACPASGTHRYARLVWTLGDTQTCEHIS